MAPETETACETAHLRSHGADVSMAAWGSMPFSMAAARVQLKLLDSAIFQKEQELEASWAKACFSCPVPYIDEEWGSPWAALVAETSGKLCGFREARGRLLARMRELSIDDDKASDSSETDAEEPRPEHRSVAENALSMMKDLLTQHLAEQAQLRSEIHSLVAQNAELRQKEAAMQERFEQHNAQLKHYEQLKAQMEVVKLRNMELEKENATLKERCFQKDWCMRKVEEQMQKIRGDLLPSTPCISADHFPRDDDISIVSELSSWVCVASSEPCVFLADVTFKTPHGQALQASELCKGSQLLAAEASQGVLEVLDDPEELVVSEVLELWAGDVILRVVPDHGIKVGSETRKAKELRPGDLVTVDEHPAALIQVESKNLSCPASAVKVTLSPDGIPPALVSRRLSEESPFGAISAV